MRRIVLAALLTACCTTAAPAADLCKAVALRDVPALDSPRSIIPKGKYDEAITQYRVNRQSGETSFCSHGGFCYPTHLLVDGRKVEALRLVNCRVSQAHPSADGDETLYGVDVIRSAIPPAQLRQDDVDNRLRELGLCNACASNVAAFYVSQPRSRCGTLARQALGGSQDALRTLQDDPPYCR